MALSVKQQRFVDEYCIPPHNATEAYRRAGYRVTNDRSAEAAASRLLSNVIVRAEVDRRMAEIAKNTRMTAVELWLENSYLARSDIGEIIDFTGDEPVLRPLKDIPERARRALKVFKYKQTTVGKGARKKTIKEFDVAMHDKHAPIVIGLKGLHELSEKVELSGKLETEVTVSDAEREAILDAMATRIYAIQEAKMETDEDKGTNPGSVEVIPAVSNATVGDTGPLPATAGEGDSPGTTVG